MNDSRVNKLVQSSRFFVSINILTTGVSVDNYFLALDKYLKKFNSFENNFKGKIPHSVTINFNKHPGHIVFSSMIHGNEVGSLPAIIKCIELLESQKIKFGGKVTFLLGNVAAAQQRKRFLEDDLNRCFEQNNNGTQSLSLEKNRAQEIQFCLNEANVFIDFHQTIMPCLKPFYIFEMDKLCYFWARATGVANIFVTRKKGWRFSAAGMCSDEYVRQRGNIGFTVELGEQGFSYQSEQYALQIMKRALRLIDQVYQFRLSIEKLSKKNDDFKFLMITHREPFLVPEQKLINGLINLQYIKKGMLLGVKNSNSPLVSSFEGYILFPKYPERNADEQALPPLPGEIFVIAEELKEHPLSWR